MNIDADGLAGLAGGKSVFELAQVAVAADKGHSPPLAYGLLEARRLGGTGAQTLQHLAPGRARLRVPAEQITAERFQIRRYAVHPFRRRYGLQSLLHAHELNNVAIGKWKRAS